MISELGIDKKNENIYYGPHGGQFVKKSTDVL